ncbi:MAG: UDP-N-acetylmuramoylalanyl-D-glutamyl-2,6-diaminopimelate--D-alanyl-D-alanine ligase [Alphaproteobacteria bacterium]
MTKPLWTGAEILATGARFEPENAAANFIATGVSIDTRTLKPGDLFVAIRGEARDGHEFAAQALGQGASAALVDHAIEGAKGTFIFADDSLKGLERLGAAARDRSAAKRIAVTGSVGKTGTKEALRTALGASGATHASEASYNNMWGVPLTLARMPADTKFGVFEIGMNHSGEITPLSRLVQPHAAIITTVEPVHLQYFDSVEEIAEAKAEIFAGLVPGGAAILNLDNPHFPRLSMRAREAGARIITFGENQTADARLLAIDLGPDGSNIRARICGTDVEYHLASPGRHVARNSLAVLAGVFALGADLASAARALNSLKPPPGRGARRQISLGSGSFTLIDESYNANPASMRPAIANLALLGAQAARRIAVLGDMLELGRGSAELHAALVDPLEQAGIDAVYLCGPMMKNLFDVMPSRHRGGYAATSKELADIVAADVRAGDAVMIKGSLGSRMKLIVERLEKLDRPMRAANGG